MSYLLETQSVGRVEGEDAVVYLQLDPRWLRVIGVISDADREIEIEIPASMFKTLWQLIDIGKVQEWKREIRKELEKGHIA